MDSPPNNSSSNVKSDQVESMQRAILRKLGEMDNRLDEMGEAIDKLGGQSELSNTQGGARIKSKRQSMSMGASKAIDEGVTGNLDPVMTGI